MLKIKASEGLAIVISDDVAGRCRGDVKNSEANRMRLDFIPGGDKEHWGDPR
ncbi:hypothetical protein [Acetobacterium woodii]|uniref:hypothetical protein n=1 Tax=Acetobacterium woodii TaxID=33952 RepID=UPI0003190824|nr:hypothetical protein [Acetobacterium woodii]